jgi:hypothetical protein
MVVMSDWIGETREWTDREEVALRTMWADGVPAQLIASHFRRSEHEVLEKAAGMRLPERVEP